MQGKNNQRWTCCQNDTGRGQEKLEQKEVSDHKGQRPGLQTGADSYSPGKVNPQSLHPLLVHDMRPLVSRNPC